MILIRLQGGLGNQLFQYAAAIQLQKKVNKKIGFFVNHLNQYETKRVFKLSFLFKEEEILFAKPSLVLTTVLKYRINKILPFLFPQIITSKNMAEIKQCDNYILDDYFQNVIQIKEGITILAKMIGKIADSYLFNEVFTDANVLNVDNIIAIHIRRGDYLNLNNKILYCYLNDEYYQTALDKLYNAEKKLFYFSDELIQLNDTNDDHSSLMMSKYGFTDVEEFLLMCKIKNIVIANSTFSFWAAISNTSVTPKNVFAPLNWMRNFESNQVWINNTKAFRFNIITNN